MAEKIILKARVAGIDFADVITGAAGLTTAVWEGQPLTFKDDEISLTEADPTESVVYSHENDAPEEVEYQGSGVKAVGTFIKATYDQMAALMGGAVAGADATSIYSHPGAKTTISTAIRFRLKNGGAVIVPCAKGVVTFSGKLSTDGLLKLPFKFNCLVQSGYDVDFVIQDTLTPAV